MKNKFPIAEVYKAASALAAHRVADFENGTQLPSVHTHSPQARAYLKAYGSIIDTHMDLSHVPAQLKESYRLAAAHSIQNIVRTTSKQEATLAGTALPTFTRQKILTVLRAYPKAMFLDLFGFIPMAGPTARMFFKTFRYADPLNPATGNVIAANDQTDDLTKFNVAYATAPEGSFGKKVTFDYKFLDISVQDERVLGEWSEQMIDDAAANYDEDAEATHMEHAAFLLGWCISRTLIAAMVAAVPAANKVSFDCNPTANPNYTTLSPSEQRQYDEKLYTHGIVECIEAIRVTNKFNASGDPNWLLVGSGVAKRLRRIKGFSSNNLSAAELSIQTGTIRDMGVLDDYGIRVLIDPQLPATKAYFGHKPVMKNDPAIYLGMYIPLQATKQLYDPNTGFTTEGVRSRFAIAQPNTGTEPASVELGRVYGELTALNA